MRLLENDHTGTTAERIQNCTYQTNSDDLLHSNPDRVHARILINSFNEIYFLNMFLVLTLTFKEGKLI
jgi:hypothetical protein